MQDQGYTVGAQCDIAGCVSPVVEDGAWAAGEARTVCARHRQQSRLRAGRCPNCGDVMAVVPIVNTLTGRPRTASGSVPTMRTECVGCGYTLRPNR